LPACSNEIAALQHGSILAFSALVSTILLQRSNRRCGRRDHAPAARREDPGGGLRHVDRRLRPAGRIAGIIGPGVTSGPVWEAVMWAIIAGAVAGLLLGGAIGHEFSLFGAIAGALVGGYFSRNR